MAGVSSVRGRGIRRAGGGRLAPVLAAVVLLPAVGCSGNKLDDGDAIVKRFVERVNDGDCDEPSGFDLDEATWSDACRATAADLDDGVVLSPEPVEERDFPAYLTVDAPFQAEIEYVNVDGVPATLTIAFAERGVLYNHLELRRIGSFVSLSLRAADTVDDAGNAATADGTNGDRTNDRGAIAPEATALIEQAEGLIAGKRCDELAALLAPSAEFGEASLDDCPAIVTTYLDTPAEVLADTLWDASVYAASTPKVTKRVDGQRYTFEAVLNDGTWYLLDITHRQSGYSFGFTVR